jgi:hypothetical protein
VSAISGLVVNVSALNYAATAVSGMQAATAINSVVSAISGISYNAVSINSAVSAVSGISYNASTINSLVSESISGLSSGVSAGLLNSISGLTASSPMLNHTVFYGQGSAPVRFASRLILGSATDNTTFTAVTAFSLTTVLGVWANVNGVANAISPNCSYTSTSVTLRLFFGAGTAVSAGDGVYCTIYAYGYS